MRQEQADAWHMHKMGFPICITTNPIIAQGGLVMGRGIARQAANKWPTIRHTLAELVKKKGSHVFYLSEFNVFSFPVKHHFDRPADIELIKHSCEELMVIVNDMKNAGYKLPVYLPRPGCGNGHLLWADVEPEITPLLSDDVVVITYARGRAQD